MVWRTPGVYEYIHKLENMMNFLAKILGLDPYQNGKDFVEGLKEGLLGSRYIEFSATRNSDSPWVDVFRELLVRCGYNIPLTGRYDERLERTVVDFRVRHRLSVKRSIDHKFIKVLRREAAKNPDRSELVLGSIPIHQSQSFDGQVTR